MSTSSLYTFGSTANVSANNFTTLYNAGGQNITPSTGYGNANVESFLAEGTDGGNTIGNIKATGNISTTGNVLANAGVYAANYYYANGAPLNTQGNYSNANVAAYLPTYTGNLAGGNLAITHDAVVSGNITSGINITSGADIQATGNIRTLGPSGNITGVNYVSASYYLGDGGLLSNIGGSYGNANVSAYLAAGISSNIVTTGNITGNYIFGNGSQLTGLPATYSNANVVSLLANFGSNVISTTGNIDAGNISATGNITVAGSLNSDDITSAGVTVYGDQIITGNLTVQGTTTTINSNTIVTNDKTITVANNQSTAANVNGAGLEAGNPAVATLLYNALTNSWQSNVGVTPVANLTQELGNNQNRWSTVYAGAIDASGNVSAAGNVAGEYVIANTALWFGSDTPSEAITADNLTMNFVTNGQTRLSITSGGGNLQGNLILNNSIGNGILNSYGVVANGNILASGFVSAAGNVTGANVNTDYVNFGSGYGNLTGGELYLGNTLGSYQNQVRLVANQNIGYLQVGTTGSNGLFRFSKWLNANTALEVDTANNRVGINKNAPTVALDVAGEISATGNITGNYILGNGSQLTGLPEIYGNANVATFLAAFGSNTIVTTGNITAGNFIGSGAYLSSLPAGNVTGTVSSANVASLVNVSNANSTSGSSYYMAFASGPGNNQVQIDDFGQGFTYTPSSGTIYTTQGLFSGNVTASGNVIAGNVTTTGLITAAGNIITTGNISGNYYIGNGSLLTGIVAVSSYGNANVVANLAALGSNPISSTGNITTTANISGNYFLGNGSQLTGLPATYGNANVAANLAAFGSNPISSTGNITTTANVSANYYLGNGSQLTGISASLPANITGNVFTSVVYSYGNATGTITPDISLGSIQTMTLTGNITLNSLANVNTGQTATFVISQDATGNRLLTSTWKFASNVRTLSTAANAIDMISVSYIGNTYYASLIRGFL